MVKGWLSEGLKGELSLQSGVGRVAKCIWYFKDASERVIIELADEFKD